MTGQLTKQFRSSADGHRNIGRIFALASRHVHILQSIDLRARKLTRCCVRLTDKRVIDCLWATFRNVARSVVQY